MSVGFGEAVRPRMFDDAATNPPTAFASRLGFTRNGSAKKVCAANKEKRRTLAEFSWGTRATRMVAGGVPVGRLGGERETPGSRELIVTLWHHRVVTHDARRENGADDSTYLRCRRARSCRVRISSATSASFFPDDHRFTCASRCRASENVACSSA